MGSWVLGFGFGVQGAFEELLGQCTHVGLPGGATRVLDEQLSLELHAEATKFSAKVSPSPLPIPTPASHTPPCVQTCPDFVTFLVCLPQETLRRRSIQACFRWSHPCFSRF